MFDGPWESCMFVKGLDPSACASWVQAWGSIAAILVAVLAAYIPIRHSIQSKRRESFEARVVLTRACYLAAEEASATLQYVARRMREKEGHRLVLRTERLEELQLTFRAIVAKDLPPGLLGGVLKIQRELSYSLMALRQLERGQAVSSERINKADSRASRVHKVLVDLTMQHHFEEVVLTGEIPKNGLAGDEDFSVMEQH